MRWKHTKQYPSKNPQYDKKARAEIKKYLNFIKESKKCEICGEGRGVCLDFHHKNRDDKEICLGDIRVLSIEIIQREVEKCMVVCANCHRIIHSNERLEYIEKVIKEEKYPLFD